MQEIEQAEEPVPVTEARPMVLSAEAQVPELVQAATEVDRVMAALEAMEDLAATAVDAATAAMAEAGVDLVEAVAEAGGEGENHETDIKQATCTSRGRSSRDLWYCVLRLRHFSSSSGFPVCCPRTRTPS